MDFNQVILAGRLTAAPELKQTQSGISVLAFGLAVNRPKSPDAPADAPRVCDFINCVAWRKTAEFINQYFTKGMAIMIVGENQVREFQTQSGEKRRVMEVLVKQALFVESKASQQQTGTYVPAPQGQTSQPQAYAPQSNVYAPPQQYVQQQIQPGGYVPFQQVPTAPPQNFNAPQGQQAQPQPAPSAAPQQPIPPADFAPVLNEDDLPF